MPELPEVEITARLLDGALRGAGVEGAFAPGLATMQTFDPPLSALEGATLTGIGRRGKLFVVGFAGGGLAAAGAAARAVDPDAAVGERLAVADATLVVHLMSAGRLQLWDARASMKDRSSRLLVRIADGERELRLREFGKKHAAWGRLLRPDALAEDPTLTTLGPEAWPDPPDPAILPPRRTLRGALRDQRVIAGIGRSWVDEILWEAQLAPLRRCGDLDDDERTRLRETIRVVLDRTLAEYAEKLSLPLPDKLPLPLQVHRRVGEPCPRCGDEILRVSYESDEMAYCATCQTGGKPYKDRRFSRLLID
ncbi:MAG: DNA-formamidopyrimidine glycosylase [Patulibacter sp.]|nr:DNA-formamidopyrimidine glycosylase [Patulibacter sp.]